MLTKKRIAQLAERAGCPSGWYKGPWFDEKGSLKYGSPPPCLMDFALLVGCEVAKEWRRAKVKPKKAR